MYDDRFWCASFSISGLVLVSSYVYWNCRNEMRRRPVMHAARRTEDYPLVPFLQDQHPGRLLKEDSQCRNTAGCGGTSYGDSAIQHRQNIESSVKSKDKTTRSYALERWMKVSSQHNLPMSFQRLY